MKLVFATNNQHKLDEVQKITASHTEIVSLAAIDCHDDIPETEANMKKLLREMEGMENRKARFRTVIALILDGKEYLFEGIVNGQITKDKRGTSGFGYDPIFMPDNHTETFAEMGNDIKNTISHRAEAVKKLSAFLSTLSE